MLYMIWCIVYCWCLHICGVLLLRVHEVVMLHYITYNRVIRIATYIYTLKTHRNHISLLTLIKRKQCRSSLLLIRRSTDRPIYSANFWKSVFVSSSVNGLMIFWFCIYDVSVSVLSNQTDSPAYSSASLLTSCNNSRLLSDPMG